MLRKRLVEPPLEQVLEFCAEEPVERVFLEDAARRGLGRFAGLSAGRRLEALCHLGANVAPAGQRCAEFVEPVLASRPRMIIGAEEPVGELWDAIADEMPEPRDDRPGQPVYVIEEPPAAGGAEVRAATIADLDLLVPACAAAHMEEIGLDPLARDPDGFRWRTRAQIEEGRSWIWRDGDRILFKAEASAWTPTAVQLQQVWVDPDLRRRGHGEAGLRDLVRLLLESAPIVCLFVRPENDAAIRLYERIGMRQALSYRSLLF